MFFSGLAVYAALESESYFISKEKNFQIEMNTRQEDTMRSFSFAEYDIEAPSICRQANIYCHEKTIVTSHVTKEWEVIPVAAIWDPQLSPQDFANFYPNLPEDKIINDWSPSSQKWILQRILYERGLLEVFPTGKIGYLTEEAITKLQYYKNIEEVDELKGIVVIGPKTIKELNKLKTRMKSDDFISNSPMPLIPFENFSPFQQQRLLTINKALQRPLTFEEKQEVLVPSLGIVKPENSGNMLKFQGEAVIERN
jgi:hypothetical protein